MTCTYDYDLSTYRDWVRRLTNDTGAQSDCFLEDEEIDALITESITRFGSGAWTKYSAAADALEMRAQSGAIIEATNGVKRKRVGRLEIEHGVGADALVELRKQVAKLRAKSAALMARRPSAFSTVGRNRRRCAGG
jgi:hypothetical protein